MTVLTRIYTAGLITMGAVCLSLAAHAEGTPCAKLKAMTIHDVAIESSTLVPAGEFPIPGTIASTTVVEPTVYVKLPAFCRVVGVARPTSDSDIHFEVWIPPSQAWNGRFEGVGTGGFSGEISYQAMALALDQGYATASTDTGHKGDELIFAKGHPEKIVDWGYRSMHVMTETAKLIVRNAMGKFPEKSYFNGCATAGHQSMMEVLRYPNDYDGVIAGNPAGDRVHEIDGYLAAWIATHSADGKSLLPSATLQMITKVAVAKCDKLDGVEDGVIDDPHRCDFDPKQLLCKAGEDASCLTQAQVDAVKKVYAGLRHPRTGEMIFPGWSIGSEGWGAAQNSGWSQLVNIATPRRSDFFKYFVFDNPEWDWKSFDFDKDIDFADKKMGFLAAHGTDLSAFTGHKGKLIMFTGLVDPILPADDVIEYYDAIEKRMGGERSKESVRFFTVPGMGHCLGGPGTTDFDMMPALKTWVEEGKAPEKVIASRVVKGQVVRTRPLCVYPKVARWNGKGSSDEANNFACVLLTQNARSAAKK